MAASEQTLLAYVAAWNEADEEKRRTLLEISWAENGIYSFFLPKLRNVGYILFV
jgi:hypothetical protein